MEYRNVGNSGLMVSEISLGSYMTYGQANGFETAKACVHTAFDLGINSFDTADVYGNKFGKTGCAEELLGDILSGYRRSSYVLATKVGYSVTEDANGKGLSRKHLLEACDASLKRLKTDYIDIYYMHLYDENTPVEETMDVLDTLVQQGKVLYTGISNWPVEAVQRANAIAEGKNRTSFKVVQPPYNMFDRRAEADSFSLAGDGLGCAVYFPLAQGILAGRYHSVNDLPKDSRAANPTAGQVIKAVGCLTAENLNRVYRMEALAGDIGLTMAELALAWILRRKEVSTILAGASKPEQLIDNVKASGVKLSEDVLSEIEVIFA